MSARQMKRMQQQLLVARKGKTSLDDSSSQEDPSDASDSNAAPTMMISKSKSTRKHQRPSHSMPPAGASAPMVPLCPSPESIERETTTTTATASKANAVSASLRSKAVPTSQSSSSSTAAPTSSGGDGKGASSASAPPLAPSTTASKKEKAAEQKRRRQAKEKEEELLLEQALSASAAVGSAVGQHGANATVSLSERAVRLLTTADVSQLDTRSERIKSFGAASVEDVGDGPTRRPGAGASNGLLPSRPPGMALPKFRESPFATPNRYNWPAFSSLGVVLKEEKKKQHNRAQQPTDDPTSTLQLFSLCWDDREFVAAQRNFDNAVQSFADVNTLLERCFQPYPYHLPTLLQLRQAFAIMGDQPNSQLMLDLAMYAVGVILGRFPLKGSILDRQLPANIKGNRVILETLHLGVIQALKRGCNRTAFHLSRLLLSMDETDPFAVLLTVDYLALRSRQWDTLLTVFAYCEAAGQRRMRGDDDEDDRQRTRADVMAQLLIALPGFHFNAALAKFLLEGAEEEAVVAAASSAQKKRSAPHATLTASVTGEGGASETALPESRIMLARAIVQFPHAAILLADKIGLDDDVRRRPEWKYVVALSLQTEDRLKSTGFSCEAMSHVSALFVERSHDLWKTKDAMNFFTRSLSRLASLAADDGKHVEDDDGDDPLSEASLLLSASARLELRVRRDMFAAETLLQQYRRTSVDDVLGETVARIAPELLNPVAQPDELQRDARRMELDALMEQGFPQTELDALARFEAVFGPLPVETPLEQRFEAYNDMLEGYRRQIGDEMNPLVLFLRTILPWNNVRDMALERAMQDRGVDDPVRQRRARERQRDERIYERDAAETQRQEDEMSSSSDEGMW